MKNMSRNQNFITPTKPKPDHETVLTLTHISTALSVHRGKTGNRSGQKAWGHLLVERNVVPQHVQHSYTHLGEHLSQSSARYDTERLA